MRLSLSLLCLPPQGLAFSAIPPTLANLTALEVLDLGGDSRSGGGDAPIIQGGLLPPQLANLTNLTTFGVTGGVNGSLPLDYARWSRLTSFRLANTQLTGSVPVQLFLGWPRLVNFSISGARLTGNVDGALNCASLQEFSVEHTPVSGSPWFLQNTASSLTNMSRLGFGGCAHTVAGHRQAVM